MSLYMPRVLLAMLATAACTGAAAQVGALPFRYAAIFDYPEAHFPYAEGPGRVTVLIGRSNVSADDAKASACADISRHLMTVRANRGARGWENVLGAPYETGLQIAESAAADCLSPANGIACSPPRFLATAAARAEGEVGYRAAGAACSGQSAAAEKAALTRCNQARQKKGVVASCKSMGLVR